MNPEDETTTTDETTADPTTTEGEPTTTEPSMNEQQLADILQALEEFSSIYQAELDRQAEERPTPEEMKAEQDKEQQEQTDLLTYREDVLTGLDTLNVTTGTTNELLEVSPDYSTAYEEQSLLLSNNFDGMNAFMGLVLGIAVAIAFIKGVGFSG